MNILLINLHFILRYVVDILATFGKKQDSLDFSKFLNKKHPSNDFTIAKKVGHSIAPLCRFLSGVNNQNLSLQTYNKYPSYAGLNFKSFTSFSK